MIFVVDASRRSSQVKTVILRTARMNHHGIVIAAAEARRDERFCRSCHHPIAAEVHPFSGHIRQSLANRR